MNTYVYIMLITAPDGKSTRVETGVITSHNFHHAAKLALDDEGCNWEYKRSKKELVSLTKVTL